MSDSRRLSIHRQTAFTDDGELEVSEESIGTTLLDHGVDVDLRERKSRIAQPPSDEFVDDRSLPSKPGSSEQEQLFVGGDDQQRTLAGEESDLESLWSSEAKTPERDLG